VDPGAENLNVLTIVFANRIYQILRGEFDGVGAANPASALTC
jgi:acetolactate synthase-1/2/3 large subunit